MREAQDDDLAFRGRIGWLLGLHDVTSEDFGSALAHYEAANLAYDRAREVENRARIDLLTAEALAKMGSRREAWQRYHRALAALTDTRGVSRRATRFSEARRSPVSKEKCRAPRWRSRTSC